MTPAKQQAQRHARWATQIRGLGARAERLYNTEYVCECSDFESHQLWERYHLYFGVAWAQHNMGLSLQIGEVDERPIMAGVTWADLTPAKHLVAFVYSPSQLIDHAMLDEWIDVAFDRRHEKRDAWNFSHLIHDMAKRDGVENYITRGGVDNLDTILSGPVMLETLFPKMTLEDRFTFAERKMQEWGERARAYEAVMKAGYHR